MVVNVLVGWDDAKEAELLSLYLNLGESKAEICTEGAQFEEQLNTTHWDIILLAMTFPTDVDTCFALFEKIKDRLPGVPVVLGCRQDEMIKIPHFLTQGLRSYIVRDERGDFIFLTMTCLESTVAGVAAERSSLLAARLREEMDSVRRLQETIIPRDLRPQKGYRTVARYEPSEVSVTGGRPVVLAGGDYYDILPVADETLVALVGDASGHGLKACMSIMTMYTLIRMITEHSYQDTAAFVTDVNRKMCTNSIVQSGGGFITMFYGAIDIQENILHWTSAGHPLALIHDLKTDTVTPVGTNADGGLPLGIDGEVDYDAGQTPLPERCRVLIYSDGLTDALCTHQNGTTQLFGVEGIVQTLRESRNRTLDEALDDMFAASRSFTDGEGRHDDTSVVLIERGI